MTLSFDDMRAREEELARQLEKKNMVLLCEDCRQYIPKWVEEGMSEPCCQGCGNTAWMPGVKLVNLDENRGMVQCYGKYFNGRYVVSCKNLVSYLDEKGNIKPGDFHHHGPCWLCDECKARG